MAIEECDTNKVRIIFFINIPHNLYKSWQQQEYDSWERFRKANTFEMSNVFDFLDSQKFYTNYLRNMPPKDRFVKDVFDLKDGYPYDKDVITNLCDWFVINLEKFNIPYPRIELFQRSSMMFSWRKAAKEINVTIDVASHKAEVDSYILDLNSDDSWVELRNLVNEITYGAPSEMVAH
jgi:hypothetical protein